MPDVVTITTGTAGAAGNTVNDLQTYFAANLLKVAERTTVLKQFGVLAPIPPGSSKTIAFVRLEKFAVATTPTQLTEAVTPDATPLSYSQFTAVAEQYGFLVKISDLASLTAKHPVIQAAMYNMGLHAAEIYDILIFNVLDATTNVYRPQGATVDTGLTKDHKVTYKDLVNINAGLKDNAARPVRTGAFAFVTPPQVYASLLLDPDFKASAQFKEPEMIWRGYVTSLAGFSIVETNSPAFNAKTQATSGFANRFYSSFAIGENAFQVSDLQNLEVIVTPPGGQGDGLKQRTLIGYKFAVKAKITEPASGFWMELVRSAGNDSANNA